jgi:hypothetical protein
MAIPKYLRFEVFRRDNFTCQYCGRRPPEVILEVDHILPLSAGGGSEPSNLVTSCLDCNRSKGKKVLTNPPKVQDLDLDYFEAEQRLAELKRYKKVKERLDKAESLVMSDLQGFFLRQVGSIWAPSFEDLRFSLYYHDPDEIEKAIVLASVQCKGNGKDKWLYACGILRNWRHNKKNEGLYECSPNLS